MPERCRVADIGENRCVHCGVKVDTPTAAHDLDEFGGRLEVARPFCSDLCERAYKMRRSDDVEEFEEVYRAGAT